MKDDIKQRVLDERETLNRKVCELSGFIHTPEFSELRVAERQLLSAQRDIMYKYIDILDARISLFE